MLNDWAMVGIEVLGSGPLYAQTAVFDDTMPPVLDIPGKALTLYAFCLRHEETKVYK
jgi:hypothetical protein